MMHTDEGTIPSMETTAFPSLSCEVTIRRGPVGTGGRVSDMKQLGLGGAIAIERPRHDA